MTVPIAIDNSTYTKREIKKPDDRFVVIFQDKKDGTILEKSLELKFISRIGTIVNSTKKNSTGRYEVIAVHSFNVEE